MRKIVVAIDSFKGSLTSLQAGEAAKAGILAVLPDCDVAVLPVADGGEGMLSVLVDFLKARYITVKAHNPLMELIDCKYGISTDGKTAIIEMAAVSGLDLIPENKRNPLLTTSYGTGELIKNALDTGCRNFIVGIGGSATNDAGLGMLQALGYRFLDNNGNELGFGGEIMRKVQHIDSEHAHPALKKSVFTIACDVDNPLYGKNGAAYVFAPQKGADEAMTVELDKGLRHLSKIIVDATGKDIAEHPGAGAAGGMGGGFLAFTNARLKKGIDLLLDVIDFDMQIKDAGLVITGEGKTDAQTLMGKVPLGILSRAKKQNIPVILIAGNIININELNKAGFNAVFCTIPYPVTLQQAMEPLFAQDNITRLLSQICRIIPLC